MIYKPLNEKKNEIRVLQFLKPTQRGSRRKIVHLTLRNVSLDKLTSKYRRSRHNDPDGSNETWRDVYTEIVDLRMRPPKPNPESSSYPKHEKIPNGRFSWGDFEALSYAWGEKDESKKVLLNGKPKAVSATLHSALHRMQKLPEAKMGMRFWIDALCINQDDIQERNHQVKRMRHIYGIARAVIVWLGRENNDDEKAIRVMNDTYRDVNQNNRLIPPAEFTQDDWSALCAFMRKPYWSRLWIIQELATNHHSTLFLCGKQALTREMLKKGADCCQKLSKEGRRFYQSIRSDIWLIATRIHRLVDLSTTQTTSSMLTTTLSLASRAEARDPKDKVFGILGLLDKSISSKIIPDYENSVQQVFADLTIAIIETTRSLEHIIHQAEPLASEWPSWVPDLRLPFPPSPRHYMMSLCKRRASKIRYAEFSLEREHETDSLLLCCRGYTVDLIDGIAASSRHNSPILPESDQVHITNRGTRALHRSLVLDHPKTHEHPALMKVPWIPERNMNRERTLTAPPIWEQVFKSRHFKTFHRFLEANKDFRIQGKKFQDFFSSSPREVTEAHAIIYHLGLAVQSLKGRKLATTKTGYIAMVPKNVQRGDVVAVLLGCNFPVLLRPSGRYFRVLGECYVHGLMNGEVFGLERTGTVSLETLLLH